MAIDGTTKMMAITGGAGLLAGALGGVLALTLNSAPPGPQSRVGQELSVAGQPAIAAEPPAQVAPLRSEPVEPPVEHQANSEPGISMPDPVVIEQIAPTADDRAAVSPQVAEEVLPGVAPADSGEDTVVAVPGLASFSSGDPEPAAGVDLVDEDLPEGGVKLTGRGTWTDHGQILLQGASFSLAGTRAPAMDLSCPDEAGGSWVCGGWAIAALSSIIEDRTLTCIVLPGEDGRNASCDLAMEGGDVDLAAFSVQAGLLAATSDLYKMDEEKSRASKTGLWEFNLEKF